MEKIEIFNAVVAIFFIVCYSYQFVYIVIPLLIRPKAHRPAVPHRYAVLISARNEERVIAQLIERIKGQTYDPALITTFVIADNCTDRTAQIARQAGAVVYERFNTVRTGKGYALDELLAHIAHDYPDSLFDGYFVFDADNVLASTYVEEMNRTFSDGHRIITGYRNSKNYGDNWISAGYGLWFLREAQYLNRPRMLLGSSCTVSGTGFLFSREILQRAGGWPYHMLTEDIEFSAANILEGERIAYCTGAVLYDEQPVKFGQSWRQRLRWSKGYLQVFGKYGPRLLKGLLKGSFSCYYMCMNIMPAIIVTVLSVFVNGTAAAAGLIRYGGFLAVLKSFLTTMFSFYMTLYLSGLITTVTEWRAIHTAWWKKLLYTFTFPLFTMTYMPLALIAIFRKVSWQPIEHTKVKNLSDILRGD